MAPTRKESQSRLEQLCLKRICQDAPRHAMRQQAAGDEEGSYYLKFQMLYSDDVVDEFQRVSPQEIIDRTGGVTKCSSTVYSAYINFIFNQHVKKIELLKYTDFNEEIASVIRRNCKDLHQLMIMGKPLASNIYLNFLKSLKNLVILELRSCSFKNVETMKAIASLEHLVCLKLNGTPVDDRGLFALCGHKWTSRKRVLSCSWEKNCEANCKLKLQFIDLVRTDVSPVGLACALTHIPVLKKMHTDLSLCETIQQISQGRKTAKICDLKLQLEELECFDHSEILRASLEACPKLKHLDLLLRTSVHIRAIGEILEESELNSLKSISVVCASTNQIFNEHFNRFWFKRGHQLNKLWVRPKLGVENVEGDIHFLRYVLTSCPKLTELSLDLLLRAPKIKRDILVDFPKLPDLEKLTLTFAGNAEFFNTVASKLILSSCNLVDMYLDFSVIWERILPCMSEEHLPCLREVLILDDPQQLEKIRSILCTRKSAVEFNIIRKIVHQH